jgi:hypothetical protein
MAQADADENGGPRLTGDEKKELVPLRAQGKRQCHRASAMQNDPISDVHHSASCFPLRSGVSLTTPSVRQL